MRGEIWLSDSICYGDKEGKGMQNDFQVPIISDWEDDDTVNRNEQIRKE